MLISTSSTLLTSSYQLKQVRWAWYIRVYSLILSWICCFYNRYAERTSHPPKCSEGGFLFPSVRYVFVINRDEVGTSCGVSSFPQCGGSAVLLITHYFEAGGELVRIASCLSASDVIWVHLILKHQSFFYRMAGMVHHSYCSLSINHGSTAVVMVLAEWRWCLLLQELPMIPRAHLDLYLPLYFIFRTHQHGNQRKYRSQQRSSQQWIYRHQQWQLEQLLQSIWRWTCSRKSK